MSRNYERLDIEAFGAHLLRSGDLDPVYIALAKLRGERMDDAQLARWLIAYWCFYSCGFACYASEAPSRDFWGVLEVAAENTEATPFGGRWPRGHERRHFRGAAASKAVDGLRQRYGSNPEGMVGYICQPQRTNRTAFKNVAERAKEHPLFGPWIAFKIADMTDRVLGAPVDFTDAEVFMFDDPVKAALMLWRKKTSMPETAKPKDQTQVIKGVVNYLTDHFRSFAAPPLGDRPVGLQEIETILCKWKSHMNGHYPLNNDIVEINTGCAPWFAFSTTAQHFVDAMPKELAHG